MVRIRQFRFLGTWKVIGTQIALCVDPVEFISGTRRRGAAKSSRQSMGYPNRLKERGAFFTAYFKLFSEIPIFNTDRIKNTGLDCAIRSALISLMDSVPQISSASRRTLQGRQG